MALSGLNSSSFLGALGSVADFSGIVGGLINTIGGNSISSLNYELEKQANMLNQQNVRETNANNYLMQKEANETNIQLQREMNDFNYRMWQENNSYNSPVAQIARAREAGINPNFVMGTPVASSPVQQTSIPTQQASHDVPSNVKAPHLESNYLAERETISSLSHLLSGLSRIPFIKEELKSQQLKNEAQKTQNEILEYDRDMREKDLADRKNVENLYNSMSLVQNVNDPSDLITPDEYDSLTDEEKKKYNTTDVDGNPLPNLLKAGFKSRAAFEAWKDVRNIPNFLQNIKTDLTQSKLRYLVDSKKIKSDDAVNALVNMDTASYNHLLYNVKKIKQEIMFNNETWDDRKRNVKAAAEKAEGENKFADETFETRKHILQMSDDEAINKVDRNALSLARKWFGDGKLTAGECAKLLLLKAAGFIE